METILTWTYLVNIVFLFLREIISGYRDEWMIINFAVLYGLIEVYMHSFIGFIISLLFAVIGIVGFAIVIRKQQYNSIKYRKLSKKFVFGSAFTLSLFQFVITLILIKNEVF